MSVIFCEYNKTNAKCFSLGGASCTYDTYSFICLTGIIVRSAETDPTEIMHQANGNLHRGKF